MRLIFIGIIITSLLGAGAYVLKLQRDNVILKENAIKLEGAISEQKTLIENQKKADQIFRDICIEVNGFYFMNYLAYWSLRLGGFVAWNGHRKRNAKIGD